MVATLPRPLHDGLRCASNDVGGPKDADTVGLTCHDKVVLLTCQMRVLVSRASAVVEHATACLALVLANSAGLRLIGAVGYDVALTEDSIMPAFLIGTGNVQKLLFGASLAHLITDKQCEYKYKISTKKYHITILILATINHTWIFLLSIIKQSTSSTCRIVLIKRDTMPWKI